MNYNGSGFRQKPLPLEELYSHQPLCHQSSFVRTNLMKSEKFDTTLRILGDYKFFYNQFDNGGKFQYIPTEVAVYRASEGLSTDSLYVSMKEKFLLWGIEKNWLMKLPWQLKLVQFQISRTIKNASYGYCNNGSKTIKQVEIIILGFK